GFDIVIETLATLVRSDRHCVYGIACQVTHEELRGLYARCAAFIVPGEEDFGIAAVEALASGKPVIARARGGSLEIVGSGCGVFFDEPSEESLSRALLTFERVRKDMNPARNVAEASRFSESVFDQAFLAAIAEAGGDAAHVKSLTPAKVQRISA
ncbi:MAG: glycosyltransferase, partial [Acidobacteriota bacterium]|nr:glycosyltransferase [Acidobacteriota bacterium]